MTIRTVFLTRFLIGVMAAARAQTGAPAAASPVDGFDDAVRHFKEWAASNGLSIVANTTDANKATEPAKFAYYDSRVSDSAKLVDLGVKFQPQHLPESLALFAASAGIEYHLNSARADSGRRKQDSASINLSFERVYNPGGGLPKPYYKGSVAYKNDRVDKGQGVTGALGISVVDTAWHLNSFGLDVDSHHHWAISPFLEIQHEDKNGIEPAKKTTGATPPVLDGDITRSKATVALEYWPFSPSEREVAQKKGRRIQLLGRYQVWNNMGRYGFFTTSRRYQRLVTASINVYLDKTQSLSVGLDHSNGENPEQDKARDRTTELAFKAKF